MPTSGKEMVRLYKKFGWQIDRIKGSHHIMTKEEAGIVAIPVHGNNSLKKGLEQALLKKLRG